MTKLYTGITTDEGFISIMEERGVQVDSSIGAEGLRDAFNLAGSDTITFESTNEDVLHTINAEPALDTFTIGGDTYSFEPNMTFEDWIASDYNTGDFVDGEGSIVKDIEGNTWVVIDGDSWEDYVPLATSIQANKAYGFVPIPYNFNIGETEYEVNPDSSWETWVSSSFNTDGYIVSGGKVTNADSSKVVCTTEGDAESAVNKDSKITPSTTYYLA